MTGSPIIRLLVAVGVFCGLGWLLAVAGPSGDSGRVHAETAENELASGAGEGTEVEFLFDSPVAPEGVEVLLFGEVIALGGGEQSFGVVAELPGLTDGVDVVVRADWGADSPQALRVRTRVDGVRHSDQTLWGNGKIENAVTIPPVP